MCFFLSRQIFGTDPMFGLPAQGARAARAFLGPGDLRGPAGSGSSPAIHRVSMESYQKWGDVTTRMWV